MSAHALLSVVLQKLPVRKTSKAGRPYAMASARDGKGMDAKWWTIFAYSEAGIEALEALAVGETFAATGSFDATIWAPEGREPRVNLTLTADVIISARKPKAKAEGKSRKQRANGRERAAASWAAPTGGAERTPHAEKGANFDDDIPF
jgi:hypothetical protein